MKRLTDQGNAASILSTSIRLTFTADAGMDSLLHTRLMRPQQAAMRVAYNALNERQETKAVYHQLRSLFPLLTGRNLNAAIEMAQAVIDSQLKSDAAYLA